MELDFYCLRRRLIAIEEVKNYGKNVEKSGVISDKIYFCDSRAEVTNMRPAKEFPAAREHFGETSTFKLSFPRLIFPMRYQKLSP